MVNTRTQAVVQALIPASVQFDAIVKDAYNNRSYPDGRASWLGQAANIAGLLRFILEHLPACGVQTNDVEFWNTWRMDLARAQLCGIHQLRMACHRLFVELTPVITLPCWDNDRDQVLQSFSQAENLKDILWLVCKTSNMYINWGYMLDRGN